MIDEATITDLELANEMRRVWFTLSYARRHLDEIRRALEDPRGFNVRDALERQEFAVEGLERAMEVQERTWNRVFARIDSEKPAWGGVCDD